MGIVRAVSGHRVDNGRCHRVLLQTAQAVTSSAGQRKSISSKIRSAPAALLGEYSRQARSSHTEDGASLTKALLDALGEVG
jgi:hypothetical protein